MNRRHPAPPNPAITLSVGLFLRQWERYGLENLKQYGNMLLNFPLEFLMRNLDKLRIYGVSYNDEFLSLFIHFMIMTVYLFSKFGCFTWKSVTRPTRSTLGLIWRVNFIELWNYFFDQINRFSPEFFRNLG